MPIHSEAMFESVIVPCRWLKSDYAIRIGAIAPSLLDTAYSGNSAIQALLYRFISVYKARVVVEPDLRLVAFSVLQVSVVDAVGFHNPFFSSPNCGLIGLAKCLFTSLALIVCPVRIPTVGSP